MDCSPPASSVLGVFQARIPERIAISCSRGSSQPRDPTASPAMAGRFFTTSTTLGNGCIYKISLGKRILFRTKLAWSSLGAQLGKNLPAMKETWVQSWVGKIHGEGKGYSLHYSGLENSMDYTVHGVAKSRTRLSAFHFQCGLLQGLTWWLKFLLLTSHVLH